MNMHNPEISSGIVVPSINEKSPVAVLEMEEAVIQGIEKTRPERTAKILNLQDALNAREIQHANDILALEAGYQQAPEDRERRNQSVAVLYSPELGYRARYGTQEISLSKGDILTAHLFGQRIDLPSSVPLEFRRELLDVVYRADQHDTRDLILAHEHALDSNHHYKRREAFNAITQREHTPDEELASGLVAEKMVFAWLKKLSIDGLLPLDIESVSVTQDVLGKMDFKITISGANEIHRRGVKIAAEDRREIGIQFTINTDKEVLDRKLQQIKDVDSGEVDDLVLMTVPAHTVKQTHKDWSSPLGHLIDINSRDPRGPTELLSQDIQSEILEKLFVNISDGLSFSKNKLTKAALREIDPIKTFSSTELN